VTASAPAAAAEELLTFPAARSAHVSSSVVTVAAGSSAGPLMKLDRAVVDGELKDEASDAILVGLGDAPGGVATFLATAPARSVTIGFIVSLHRIGRRA
jgi:hypothetical protein